MSEDEELNSQIYKNLLEQVFALAYYGKIDASFVVNLPTEDRHYLLKHLSDTKKKEEEEYKKAARKTEMSIKKPKINPRVKF